MSARSRIPLMSDIWRWLRRREVHCGRGYLPGRSLTARRRPSNVHPFTVYRALRTINPSPYMFYLDFVNHQIVGASPELLVRLEGRTVTNHPIAGTRPRGTTRRRMRRLRAIS